MEARWCTLRNDIIKRLHYGLLERTTVHPEFLLQRDYSSATLIVVSRTANSKVLFIIEQSPMNLLDEKKEKEIGNMILTEKLSDIGIYSARL